MSRGKRRLNIYNQPAILAEAAKRNGSNDAATIIIDVHYSRKKAQQLCGWLVHFAFVGWPLTTVRLSLVRCEYGVKVDEIGYLLA